MRTPTSADACAFTILACGGWRLATGLGPAQMSVLVGGPDWPTSVLCGILKLPLLKMLLGTSPIIVPIILCVLTGGGMVKSAETEKDPDSIWPALTSIFGITAAVMLSGSGLFFVSALDRFTKEHHQEVTAVPDQVLRASCLELLVFCCLSSVAPCVRLLCPPFAASVCEGGERGETERCGEGRGGERGTYAQTRLREPRRCVCVCVCVCARARVPGELTRGCTRLRAIVLVCVCVEWRRRRTLLSMRGSKVPFVPGLGFRGSAAECARKRGAVVAYTTLALHTTAQQRAVCAAHDGV